MILDLLKLYPQPTRTQNAFLAGGVEYLPFPQRRDVASRSRELNLKNKLNALAPNSMPGSASLKNEAISDMLEAWAQCAKLRLELLMHRGLVRRGHAGRENEATEFSSFVRAITSV